MSSEVKINVLSLPFAGGNRYSFRGFQRVAPNLFEFVTFDYPGRGERTKEGLIKDIDLLVEDIFEQTKKHIDGKRYAIYGHSLGGLLSWLLARKIVECRLPPPVHLFISGTVGPASIARVEDKKRHLMEGEDFLQEMRELKGIPDEFFENKELLTYFEPILRADFQASETYVHREGEPLNIPLTVMSGTEEDGEPEDYSIWQQETTGKVDFYRLPGGHFFIYDHAKEIIEIISKKLSIYL